MEHQPSAAIEPVRRFADVALDRARDDETPLFADALDPETREPAAHDARDVAEGAVLSNLAAQQEFLRTLVGLSALAGEGRYRDAAAEVVEHAFDELAGERGLLQWGGHVAYDLEAGRVRTKKGGPHELKWDYPFYEFFWDVDPDATRRYVEAAWNAHVEDWSRLDFNRHGEYDAATDPTWDHEYEGGDVFFWGDGLTFVNAGSDLYHAAGSLASFTGEDAPLRWAERMARRYVETRGKTGISGYQFSQHPSWCNGPAIRGDRAQYQFAPYLHGDHDVYEGTLFRPRPTVQRRQLVLGERLGERGEAFTRWALEELEAWREAAYRPGENTFEPMLTDGLSLEGFVIRREGYFGPKGRVIGPVEAGTGFLRVYAQAYRVSGRASCLAMVRDLVRGNGFGEVGEDGEAPDLSIPADAADHDALYAFLELHRATGREAYLDAAWAVGEHLVETRYRDGLFLTGDGPAVLEDPTPLALLHLAATSSGDLDAVPEPGRGPSSPSGGI